MNRIKNNCINLEFKELQTLQMLNNIKNDHIKSITVYETGSWSLC
jgi:hypothetical protein